MEPNVPQQSGQWAFSPDGATAGAQVPQEKSQESVVQWSASEFIAYQKTAGWYILAVLGLIVLAAAVFLLSGGDYISSGSIVIIGILFLAYASRKPRVLNYAVGSDGIHIGDKLYNYATIKSFAVIEEGSLRSISLLPMQRFMPAISMYFEPQEEQKIIAALSSYIPREERKQDAIDRLMHRIRF